MKIVFHPKCCHPTNLEVSLHTQDTTPQHSCCERRGIHRWHLGGSPEASAFSEITSLESNSIVTVFTYQRICFSTNENRLLTAEEYILSLLESYQFPVECLKYLPLHKMYCNIFDESWCLVTSRKPSFRQFPQFSSNLEEKREENIRLKCKGYNQERTYFPWLKFL